MKVDRRSQVLSMVAVALGAALLASLWMHWATIGFDASAGMLGQITLKASGWKVHDFLDIVIAFVAVMAVAANLAVAAGNERMLNGAVSLFSGIVAGGAVAWTMVEPPVPEIFDVFNAIPGVPDLRFDPAFGLFVALGTAVGLVLVGILQMGGSADTDVVQPYSPATAPTTPAAPPPSAPRPPDPFAKTTPPAAGASPQMPGEKFIDPVTGEPKDG